MTNPKSNRLPFYYGWIIVAAGTLCTIASLGFGRFALGMLLPSMAVTLELSYAQMGFISTGNFIGYLVAVFFSGMIVARIGQRNFIFLSLLLVGLTMSLLSRSGTFAALLALYVLTGMGSGGANVSMMSLASTWFERKNRGKAAGYMAMGSGIAIVFAGLFIPYVNRINGAEGWRGSWLSLGAMVVTIAFLCLVFLRNKPADLGLAISGESGRGSTESDRTAPQAKIDIYRSKAIYHLGAIYFLFGYTYVIYATFIVTTLVKERGLSEALAGNFWSVVGFLSLFSGPVFGSVSDKLGRKTGMMIVFSFQFLAYLLVASGLPGIFLYLSIFCYGLVAWSIPAIMAAAVGDYAGPENAARGLGFITLIFGLGQISGPAIAGMLAERSGSFSSSFYMAAAMAGAAILLSATLKPPRH
ncbi:MAG: MFS transporter [Burkholderiales bacterium]|nr:MFS transporter [Burkholderiales bacterium]